MKWTLLVTILAAGTFAKAAAPQVEAFDISTFSQSPLQLLEGLAPEQTPGQPAHQLPKPCADAAITDDQKTQIREAVYQADRDKIQLEANLKLAFMTYGHTIMDSKSDLTAAQTAGAAISDSLSKLADNKISLKNNILYTILKPEQREAAAACMMIMEKMMMHRKMEQMCRNLPHDHNGGGHHGHQQPPQPGPGPQPEPSPTPPSNNQ